MAKKRGAVIIGFISWGDGVAAWNQVESLYLKMTDKGQQLPGTNAMPPCPASSPWVSVILPQELAAVSPDDIAWMGDFERCIGWAVVEMFKK